MDDVRPPELAVARDPAGEAAARIVGVLQVALRERPRATLAVSGGHTPVAMFDVLATSPLPWERIDVLQVDERVAPDGDPDRNANDLAAHLPAAAVVHLMPVTDPDLAAAASRYAALLMELTGDGVLDVVHLGLGDDGHTASWPPGDAVADERSLDVAVVGPFNGRMRMTLTPPAVNRARARVVLVTGQAKAGAVASMLAGDRAVPASVVVGDDTVVVADAAAAGAS